VRRADHSSRGVLPSVVCLKCDSEASIMRGPWPTGGAVATLGKKNISSLKFKTRSLTIDCINSA
jgi:hypothetical protein